MPASQPDPRRVLRLSHFLSKVLRHRPDILGLTLDPNGWVRVDELLAAADRSGMALTPDLLRRVVAENDKQRFAFSPDGTRIRASQGHSLPVDLDLPPREPPALLYHGTATRFLESIRAQGLLRRNRQHVHLSADEATAATVGRRYGAPVVLRVRAGAMHAGGLIFFLSDNGVWLTEAVPAQYIEFPPEQ